MKVMMLAKINGISFMIIPYKSHINTPLTNIKYISNDIESVFFVFIVFKAWGKKENVVKNAAKYPI